MATPTLVPNCSITYSKDLSKFILDFNALEFPWLFGTSFSKIELSVLFNGNQTSLVDLDITTNVTPFQNSCTGTISCSELDNVATGVGTLFLSELKDGDVIQIDDGINGTTGIISSIETDTSLIFNSSISDNIVSAPFLLIRPKLEINSLLINNTYELEDGEYSFLFTYTYDNGDISNSQDSLVKYVYANQYKCVYAKLMNLALHCSEGCVDMETLKNTLLLKALLDALEIALNKNDTMTVSLLTEKIDRYCLLLNNNCTSC